LLRSARNDEDEIDWISSLRRRLAQIADALRHGDELLGIMMIGLVFCSAPT